MARGVVRLIVALLLLLALYVVLSRFGFLPGFGGLGIGGGADSPGNASTGFDYKISRNEFGDRVLLRTRAKVTYTAEKDAPDQIDILPNKGDFDGNFTWTLVPDQGGEHRLLGEYAVTGRVYKVCEYLMRARGGAAESAQRFQPINNDGPRYHMPIGMDPAPLHALYDAMLSEESKLSGLPKGSTDEVAISSALLKMANDDTYLCLGNPPPR
jgi:hypothetical protein